MSFSTASVKKIEGLLLRNKKIFYALFKVLDTVIANTATDLLGIKGEKNDYECPRHKYH